MSLRSRIATLLAAALVLGTTAPSARAEGGDAGRVETNVTRSATRGGGNIQIAVNPLQPNNIVFVSEYLSANPGVGPASMDGSTDFDGRDCFAAVSHDGGRHFSPVPWPSGDYPHCTHPGVAVDERGVFYIGFNPLDDYGKRPDHFGAFTQVAWSTDGGRSWSSPADTPSMGEGMRLRVDRVTGRLFEAGGSTSPLLAVSDGLSPRCDQRSPSYDPATPVDQCLVWAPPRRFDGTALAVHDGIVVSAAHGLIGHMGSSPTVSHFVEQPEAATTFSLSVSTDDGLTWTQRPIPGSDGGEVWPELVSADPTQRGRFAAMQFKNDALEVFVTPDAGVTWAEPVRVPMPGADKDKIYADFGSTGTLGVIWQDYRTGITYTAVSFDHGRSFSAPRQVNSVAHAFCTSNGDNGAWITLDARYVYSGWADCRSGHNDSYFSRMSL